MSVYGRIEILSLLFFDIHTHTYTKEGRERERVKFQDFLFLSLVEHACPLSLSSDEIDDGMCVYL